MANKSKRTHPKLLIAFFLSPFLLPSSVSASVIIGEFDFIDETSFGMTPSPGGTISTPFEIAAVSWGFTAVDIDTFTFPLEASLAADGFQAFQVPFESLLGPANTPTSLLVASNLGEPVSNFDIPDGDSIFLAHVISPDVAPEFRTYGWIELENNGGVITSGGSAIATQGDGIIVGTTTTIPEPTTTALSMFLLLPILRRKRHSA